MQPLLLYSGEQYAGSSNESYFSKVRVRARARLGLGLGQGLGLGFWVQQ
jgi:hypothetical protein